MSELRHYQQGATLIVVLIMLLLITLIGVYAVRQSVVTLNVATNAQVSTLLMQSSDVALSKLERDFRARKRDNYESTPIGRIANASEDVSDLELQFCYKPSETTAQNNNFFSLIDYRIVRPGAVSGTPGRVRNVVMVDGTVEGYCDPATMFTSGRQAVVTQIYAMRTSGVGCLSRYSCAATGEGLGPKTTSVNKHIRFTVLSFAPAMASGVSTDSIRACLRDRLGDVTHAQNSNIETSTACLNALGVPVNTQTQEYALKWEVPATQL